MYQFESSLQILCKLWNFFNKNATLDQEYVAKDIEFNRNVARRKWENEKGKRISADGKSFQSDEKVEVSEYVQPQDIQCTRDDSF